MKQPLPKKLLIFDFDGTIADTLKVSLTIANELAQDFGWEEVDREQFFELKQKSVPELMKMAGISPVKLPRVLRKARRSFKRHLAEVPPVSGMPEVLQQLKDNGFQLGVLTSNTKRNVKRFLAVHDLQLFDFIYAPDKLNGKGVVLKKILRKYRLTPAEIVMIGDELRDMEAAQSIPIDGIGVTWGFHNADHLQQAGPRYVLSEPRELLGIFEQMSTP